MRKLLWPVAALLVAALAVGLWAFQPWRAVTSSTVDEAAPTSAEPTAPATAGSATARPRPHGGSGGDDDGSGPQAKPSAPAAPRDEVLARGAFEDAEHATAGRAAVLRLADGRRFVRLEGFDTSDGPDLHVWLSDAPSGGEWGSYDDGRSVPLGDLKATSGNQNYEVPADADLRGMRSVVIWCDRFDVAFGSAPVSL